MGTSSKSYSSKPAQVDLITYWLCIFRYNCVSLGLTIWAVYFLSRNNHVLGAIAFSLALNYKQMSLYHSLPFFFYLLGVAANRPTYMRKVTKLTAIGLAVLATFAICWFPYLTSLDDAGQVLKRLFPFNRGLYEVQCELYCDLLALQTCALTYRTK